MKKLTASILVLALVIAAAPINLIAAGRAVQNGQVAGDAVVDGKPIPNTTVRLRDRDKAGALIGSSTTNGAGGFSFTGLQAGNYIVEVVAANGTILGTTAVSLTATTMTVTGLSITASAAAVTAAGGTAAVLGTAAAVGTGAGLGTGMIVAIVVGTGLGVTGLAVAMKDSSPSQ